MGLPPDDGRQEPWAVCVAPDPRWSLRDVFTAAVKLVYIASGRIDLALSPPGGATCEWDNAPGRIIAEEACGTVSGFLGEELSYVQPDPKNYAGFAASATPELHAEALTGSPTEGQPTSFIPVPRAGPLGQVFPFSVWDKIVEWS